MFCSRCHGCLVEKFSQIVMYGKSSSQQEGAVAHLSCNRLGISKSQKGQGDDQDPSIHPWGCLTTTRDGTLSLLDCYSWSTSLKGIQNVFDNARTRERERKLLYPDACGVGGRRWKGPESRETCSVHTDQLPLEKLVDFWSSQGEESRKSLLKMKKEDFIEQLTFRFANKKFCKDCKSNVVRVFKESKELMIIRKESAFNYEISHDTVRVDWSHTFIDTYNGTYRHFEWAIGRENGKSDISAFKNVGLSKIVQVNGLDLSGLEACYITLRAWKTDGACTELSIKAHTLRGRHWKLVVGNGFVSLTEGESILHFFKHAEEVVEEDNILVDENGNRLGECSQFRKHAKTPELARKFLLDAATVFFKEQVEKSFRERRAHQNAHSIFVSLALKMLEERAHVACKEILMLDNQIKLLEEEVKVKNEEEERKERRRIKEREKKLRRKERRENEKNRNNCSPTLAPKVKTEESTIVDEEPDAIETGKIMSSRPVSPHMQDEQRINGYMKKKMQNSSNIGPDENFGSSNDKNASSGSDQLKYSEWKLKNQYQQDTTSKCYSGIRSYSESDVTVGSSTLSDDDMEPCKPIEPLENGEGHPNLSHMYLQAQCIPAKQDPMQKQLNAAGEENVNSNISQAEDKGFSFFHFGGPFALADAYKSDILPSEDAVGGLSPIKFIHHNEGKLTSNKRDSIEEYNLFASDKGITFSIF